MDLITAYKDMTDAIEAVTGFSRPMLHLHAGMMIYIATQALLRERRGSVAALSMVVIAELGNEVMNRLYWGSWRPRDYALLADDVSGREHIPSMALGQGRDFPPPRRNPTTTDRLACLITLGMAR
jgi:hypothetical protein